MQTIQLDAASLASEPRATSKAIEAITQGVAKSKRAVLLVGAGISTNAGIPDFRSQGSGLYSFTSTSTSAAAAGTLKGPELFSASVYRSPETTAEHLRFISTFRSSLDRITSRDGASPTNSPVTKTHEFMGILKKRGQLLRVYTQNIDGLEAIGTRLKAVPLEGLTPSTSAPSASASASASISSGSSGKGKGKGKARVDGDFVQLHGSVHAVRCTGCDFVRTWTPDDEDAFSAGEVGACPQCEERALARSIRGQRSLSSLRRAFLRPSITLYDEAPVAALTLGSLSVNDLSASPDFLLVMGTSLRIPGFKKLVKEFSKAVKAKGGVRVLVNRDEIGGKAEWKDVFDFQVLADTDSFVERLVSSWKTTRSRDWVGRQATLGEIFAPVAKKGAVDASCKPRRPLAAISPNSPSTSSLPLSRNLLSLSEAPRTPTKKRLLQPASATFTIELPSHPSLAKRRRLAESPAKEPTPAHARASTPITSRTTRTALRASTPVPPATPTLPRVPLSPSLRPSSARRLSIGSQATAGCWDTFKPPRRTTPGSEGERTATLGPGPALGKQELVISPELW
ncbi:hypothetical protein JCM10207_003664 [Rhodosporidiobolus poonsookiae]